MSARPLALLANDDGVAAAGLLALRDALAAHARRLLLSARPARRAGASANGYC